MLLCAGVLELMHRNVADIAERLTDVLHVNRDGKLSNLFLKLANDATDRTLWVLAIGALVYAAVHLTQAYGLWRGRAWAQWFALVTTALYLPAELYWLLRHATWVRCAVFVANLLILVFMLTLRVRAFRLEEQIR